jgi:hypothetical protein
MRTPRYCASGRPSDLTDCVESARSSPPHLGRIRVSHRACGAGGDRDPRHGRADGTHDVAASPHRPSCHSANIQRQPRCRPRTGCAHVPEPTRPRSWPLLRTSSSANRSSVARRLCHAEGAAKSSPRSIAVSRACRMVAMTPGALPRSSIEPTSIPAMARPRVASASASRAGGLRDLRRLAGDGGDLGRQSPEEQAPQGPSGPGPGRTSAVVPAPRPPPRGSRPAPARPARPLSRSDPSGPAAGPHAPDRRCRGSDPGPTAGRPRRGYRLPPRLPWSRRARAALPGPVRRAPPGSGPGPRAPRHARTAAARRRRRTCRPRGARPHRRLERAWEVSLPLPSGGQVRPP